MGNVDSRVRQPAGFRVVKVFENSPADECGLELGFDNIVELDCISFICPDKVPPSVFFERIAACEGETIKIVVFNSQTRGFRDLWITPRQWSAEKKGLLGASVRFVPNVMDHLPGLRVLEVYGRSPALEAGLEPMTDYIMGTQTRDFATLEDLVDTVSSSITLRPGKPLDLLVYRVKLGKIELLQLTPSAIWGGPGSLGCNIGEGILHRIPETKIAPHEGSYARYEPSSLNFAVDREPTGRRRGSGASSVRTSEPAQAFSGDLPQEVNETFLVPRNVQSHARDSEVTAAVEVFQQQQQSVVDATMGKEPPCGSLGQASNAATESNRPHEWGLPGAAAVVPGAATETSANNLQWGLNGSPACVAVSQNWPGPSSEPGYLSNQLPQGRVTAQSDPTERRTVFSGAPPPAAVADATATQRESTTTQHISDFRHEPAPGTAAVGGRHVVATAQLPQLDTSKRYPCQTSAIPNLVSFSGHPPPVIFQVDERASAQPAYPETHVTVADQFEQVRLSNGQPEFAVTGRGAPPHPLSPRQPSPPPPFIVSPQQYYHYNDASSARIPAGPIEVRSSEKSSSPRPGVIFQH